MRGALLLCRGAALHSSTQSSHLHSASFFLTAGDAMPKYTAASPDEPAPARAGADQWRTCVLCALGLLLLVAALGLSWIADAAEINAAASTAACATVRLRVSFVDFKIFFISRTGNRFCVRATSTANGQQNLGCA